MGPIAIPKKKLIAKFLSNILKLIKFKLLIKNAKGRIIKILTHLPLEKKAIKIAASVKIIPADALKKSANCPKILLTALL